MKYPDIKTYEMLYRRFLQNDRSNEMLDIAGDISGKVFLDICCGGGRLTEIALDKRTKKNIMIDSEAKMIRGELKSNAWTQIMIMDVKDALDDMRRTNNIVDVAVCQQAINYWLTDANAWRLSLLMPHGGVFVFNTFNNKPSEIPKVREYTCLNPFEMDERHYTEISWAVKYKIHHVQICQGLEPHFTTFDWMSEEYIRHSLEKYFNVELITDNKTSIYKCVKK